LESIVNNRKWLQELTAKIQSANRAEEPPAKCQEIQDTQNNFINEYSKIINKAKPKPQEPPKQEKKDIVDETKQEPQSDKKDEKKEEPPKKDMDIEK